MAKTRSRQGDGGQLHQIGGEVLFRQLELPAGLPPLKDRPRFHDQVIDREMGWIEGEGLVQLLLPLPGGGPRESLDQIQAPTHELSLSPRRLQPGGRLEQIRAAMPAAQTLQHRVIKTLAAEADAVDPRLEIALQAGLIKAGGIELQADLGTGREAEALPQAAEQSLDLRGREHRGGAAPHIDRGERRPGG